MKKLLTLLSLLVVAVSTYAQEFTIGDLTYSVLSEEEKTAQVVNGKNAIGDVVVPETVTYEDVEYSVTTIGTNAFCGNANIISVEMPSVLSIREGAFLNCPLLVSVPLTYVCSVGNFAFKSCSSLESISFPIAALVGEGAFSECTSLVSISLPAVVIVGSDAFSECSSLASVSLPAATSIGEWAFSECSSLASVSLTAATSIGYGAFWGCSSLASVSLPAATSIGSAAFLDCSSLASVSLPATTSIGSAAFRDCTSLESVSLPAATSIGEDAFYCCSSITSLSLPVVTSIGSAAFSGCTKISSLRIGSVEQWCKVHFDNNSANPLYSPYNVVDLYIGDSETPVTSIEIPSTVAEIADYAFRKTTITSVSAPAITFIGREMFYGCTSLASVSLPAATSIGYCAFYGCSTLESVYLPVAISIDSYAFQDCSSITSLSLPVVTSIGSAAFSGCTKISSLRIGSVEQWCKVHFDNNRANPLYSPYNVVDLYIGDSETPVTSIEIPSTVAEIADYAFRKTTITSVSAPAITSIGSYAFYECFSLASVSLPAATSIDSYAFKYCSSLASVSLPAATSIGSYAFQYCSSLASVSLPAATSIGSYAFCDCTSLASVSLLAATSIGSYAFAYCNNINSLHVGSVEQWCNIEYGNTEMSSSCYPLWSASHVNIYIGDAKKPASEITVPASVQRIPDCAFNGTSIHTIHFEGVNPPALTSTRSFPTCTMLAVPDEAYETYLAADVYKTIPLQITKDGHITHNVEVEADNRSSRLMQKIGGEEEARYVVNLKVTGTINSYDMLIIRNQMTSLRNLDLADASIVDCDYVYSNADGVDYHSQKDVVTGEWLKNVMNVKLPATTKSIGERAFYNNTRLLSVEIPDCVTSIDDYAFAHCGNIRDFSLPRSVTSFGTYAFYGCNALTEISITEGTTSIASGAFYGCRNLKKVTIPESVKRIEDHAFYGCQPLELHISSMDSWLQVQNGQSTFDNVAELYIGDVAEPVAEVVIPEGIPSLKDNAFVGFKCLQNVTLPASLSSIGDYAFSGCTGLTDITLSENLTNIGRYAFDGCSKLEKIELPPYLETIGSYAFRKCPKLTEILIPASIKEIGDYAFQSCKNLNRVIATTVEPVRINQNTFSTYQTASLFIPLTSYDKYYWNTQYNQFLEKKEYDKEYAKSFEYKYFYLNGQNGDVMQDLELNDETGILHGVGEGHPDADFNEGAGMIVAGEQIQELGDIHIHHNGNNGASVIAKNNGKVHIDNLYVDIKTQKNRWYFFCFPFDINPGEAAFDGSHVWYLYDGEARAQNGNGGWKKVAADGVMQSGNGYIFQGAVNGTLIIHVQDITIDTSDTSTNMITYQSDNKNDASWNLIGNSNFAYYDIDNLGYDAPITVYNNETGNYEAVRAGEDDCELYPFQAFFVQKPEGTESMDFDNSKKDTKNKSDEKKAKKAAERAKSPKKVDAMRKVINLEIAAVDVEADSIAVPADRTRIVINPTKSTDYETDCDAAKFIAENIAQIYSLDADGCKYAINERPVGNGVVDLAVKAPKEGFFTISAPRLDCAAKLRDLETGNEVDLAKGGYTFAAEATTYTKRFQLVLGGTTDAIMTPEMAASAIGVENGAININAADADVKVYSVGGSLVATHKGTGSVNVTAGAYVVVVNGQSVKVTVNE